MILACPQLLPAAWPGPRVPGLVFLDPGATDQPEEGGFRPPALPRAPREARRMLNDFLNMGEGFRKPGDIAGLKAAGLSAGMSAGLASAPAGPSESESAIEAEVAARLGLGGAVEPPSGGEASGDMAALDWLRRSQLLLLLARQAEERLLESRELSARMAASLSRFDAVIGDGLPQGGEPEDLDPDAERLGRVTAQFTAPEGEEPAPWQPVLAAMLAFAPAGCVLATAEAALVAAVEELGATFVPAGELGGLPGDFPEEWKACRAGRTTAEQLFRAALGSGAVPPGLEAGTEYLLVLAVA
jgi:hypothetical protein